MLGKKRKEPNKKLKEMFVVDFITLHFIIALFLGSFAYMIYMIINEYKSGEIVYIVGGCIAIIGFVIGIIIGIKELKKYFKDFKCAIEMNFKEVTGTIIRFAKNIDPESGSQCNNFPIIKINGTESTIELQITTVVNVGETYTFIHLENTKSAEIKCKVDI